MLGLIDPHTLEEKSLKKRLPSWTLKAKWVSREHEETEGKMVRWLCVEGSRVDEATGDVVRILYEKTETEVKGYSTGYDGIVDDIVGHFIRAWRGRAS